MICDLTQIINEDLPVYPGDSKVKYESVGGVEAVGFLDHFLTMNTHSGTHIDAPAHMIAGGKELKDFPVERFVRRGVCIDARSGFEINEIEKAVVQEGLVVLFYTSASDYFHEEKYWSDFPVLDEACTKALINKKVSMVGIDAGSFDSQEDFPVHKSLLGADILLIENLTNLKALINQTFDIYALPIKLEKDGAPARVIAITK